MQVTIPLEKADKITVLSIEAEFYRMYCDRIDFTVQANLGPKSLWRNIFLCKNDVSEFRHSRRRLSD